MATHKCSNLDVLWLHFLQLLETISYRFQQKTLCGGELLESLKKFWVELPLSIDTVWTCRVKTYTWTLMQHMHSHYSRRRQTLWMHLTVVTGCTRRSREEFRRSAEGTERLLAPPSLPSAGGLTIPGASVNPLATRLSLKAPQYVLANRVPLKHWQGYLMNACRSFAVEGRGLAL